MADGMLCGLRASSAGAKEITAVGAVDDVLVCTGEGITGTVQPVLLAGRNYLPGFSGWGLHVGKLQTVGDLISVPGKAEYEPA